MSKVFLSIIFGGSLALMQVAYGQEPSKQIFNVIPNQSTLTYTVHATGGITKQGTSHQLQGTASLSNSKLTVGMNVPVASFLSGDTKLDDHMKADTQSNQHPTVTVMIEASNFSLPSGGSESKEVDAKINFHGKTQSQKIPLQLTRRDGTHFEAKGNFTIKLRDFGITPPSFLLLSVQNDVPIAFDVKFEAKG